MKESDGVSVRAAGSFTFRHSRLASSLSSLYKNYDIHMDIVKIIGVLVLLSLMSATLTITNNLHVCESKNNSSDCIKLATIPVTINQQFNSTLCSFMKQFEMPGEYYVTICVYQKEVRIDFRQFINGYPTVKGLYFNVRQWQYLKRLESHIDKLITTAMTVN